MISDGDTGSYARPVSSMATAPHRPRDETW